MTTANEHDPASARFVDRGVTTDVNPVSLSDLISESSTVPETSVDTEATLGEPS
ncbi:hypothetical protein OG439_27700 [Amycolatopsis sp. NBC_01307]|uniref:hypothetical protein n=1 Tax=Amycolatopsis sp. NBC_01307 TaxID=2903561 RepID=UPI002E1078D2|nr:hypothetical protein OG439_27700 [Amycolatopsis sp. NBC_01307]